MVTMSQLLRSHLDPSITTYTYSRSILNTHHADISTTHPTACAWLQPPTVVPSTWAAPLIVPQFSSTLHKTTFLKVTDASLGSWGQGVPWQREAAPNPPTGRSDHHLEQCWPIEMHYKAQVSF